MFREVKSPFSADDISIDTRVIEIEASHTTFASKIIFFVLTDNMISGYTYALHKGYPVAMGPIKLFRVEPLQTQ